MMTLSGGGDDRACGRMEGGAFTWRKADAPRRGIFDALAPVCVVLCMPKKIGDVTARLTVDRPHSNVFIQTNNVPYKGKMAFDVRIRSTVADICVAYANAFETALGMGLHRLMVLEDDFFIGSDEARALAESSSLKISMFMQNNVFDVYNIGRVAFLGFPASGGTWRALWQGAAQCGVYSSRFMVAYLDAFRRDPTYMFTYGIDVWWNKLVFANYVYSCALVFQTFPKTANRAEWSNWLYDSYFYLVGFEESASPGFEILNVWSKMTSALIIAVSVSVAAGIAVLISRMSRRAAACRAPPTGTPSPR